MEVTPGVYRHFKGNYYCVVHVVKGCSQDSNIEGRSFVVYYRLFNPEQGYFIRPLDEFISENCLYYGSVIPISQRPDNVTGQTRRFKRMSRF